MRSLRLLSRVLHHTQAGVTREAMRAQYRRSRAYSDRFNRSGNLPCGYQDHYGEVAEQEGIEARAMGIAYMILTYGGCRKFADLCTDAADNWGAT